MIGADFEKIHFVLFGLNLVEPMAFITDLIMGSLSIYFAFKVRQIESNLAFYTYWRLFFVIFGYGAILGGIGHTFFNQLGVAGKFPSWICGPLTVYCLEQAMISIHPIEKRFNLFKLISTLKLFVVYTVFIVICINAPITEKIELPFLPIAINTILGVSFAAGILAYWYKKKLSAKFKYFYLGVLVMLPASAIFLLKINLHQWFDKNDLSHVLMSAGIIYFYIGITKISKGLKEVPLS
ncbi:MAG: hypothetical protein IPH24_01425 [Crocinitomicaceae bacterium]|nr:hypothetical protein [Crocinitomicaceae bacterium]